MGIRIPLLAYNRTGNVIPSGKPSSGPTFYFALPDLCCFLYLICFAFKYFSLPDLCCFLHLSCFAFKVFVLFLVYISYTIQHANHNTAGATCGAGTAYSSGAPELTLGFSGVRVARSVVFCVMFCLSLFVSLSFSFWPLCCMSFFAFPFLNTPLVSSSFSYKRSYWKVEKVECNMNQHNHNCDHNISRNKTAVSGLPIDKSITASHD